MNREVAAVLLNKCLDVNVFRSYLFAGSVVVEDDDPAAILFRPLFTPVEHPTIDGEYDSNSNTARVTVKNTDSRPLAFVQVNLQFYNDNGTVIGSASDDIEELPADKKWKSIVTYDDSGDVTHFGANMYIHYI